MNRFYSYKLGSHLTHEYVLTVSGSPSLNEVDSFAVTVHYTEDGTTYEIARIDTAHGYTHFDQLYRKDQPKEPFDGDVFDAEEKLKNDWRQYAESYERNHR